MKQKVNKKIIWKPTIALIVVSILVIYALNQGHGQDTYNYPSASKTWWDFQAIDTMKYSRDLAGEKVDDLAFGKVIDKQVKDIADAGATHIAIATPYDEEFLPYLKRWVDSARRNNLKVWFRGNFAGWEQWFGFKKITREEHLAMTREFILANQDLFENGDYFTACPECENGGPGNPFTTGDFEGHKKFLIDSYNVTSQAFKEAGKNVQVNLNSMNGDIAKKIMDEKITPKLGGVVTVDHYVGDPKKLNDDINEFAAMSNSQVVLGEYGAPIPDIHGNLTEQQQADWIDKSMALLIKNKNLQGISYWTNMGGSTQIWNDNGTPRKAVEVIKKYFKPKIIEVKIIDELGRPVVGARVMSVFKRVSTDNQGIANIPVIGDEELMYLKDGYTTLKWDKANDSRVNVVLRPTGLSLLYRLRLLLKSPF